MTERMFDITKVNFESFRNLTEDIITANIFDDETNEHLMTGFMNKTALELTLERREVVFYSRSRKALWFKGDTSGNRFLLRRIVPDCDGDALDIYVEPLGPACHTGAGTCFLEQPAIEEDKERI